MSLHCVAGRPAPTNPTLAGADEEPSQAMPGCISNSDYGGLGRPAARLAVLGSHGGEHAASSGCCWYKAQCRYQLVSVSTLLVK